MKKEDSGIIAGIITRITAGVVEFQAWIQGTKQRVLGRMIPMKSFYHGLVDQGLQTSLETDQPLASSL